MTLRRLLLVGALVLCACAPAQAADRTATPSTFASVYAAAQAGDTVLLASGSYGTFVGSVKPGVVTVKPQPGARASMALDFTPAANLTIEGVTVTSAELSGATTRNITIRDSRFTGLITLRTATWANANVLLDRNTHLGITNCSSCGDGRIYLPQRNETAPSGVTISNSLLGEGGLSDGILNGSNGTRIIGNEFRGFAQVDGSTEHTDPIQLYGSKNTVIRANYLHDNQVASGIMAPDDLDHEVIEDNVIVQPPGADRRTLNIGGDDGSIIRHNTLVGTVMLKADKNALASRLAVLKDNIVTEGVSIQGGSTIADRSHNLGAGMAGSSEISGQPTFEGGTGREHYRLSPLSLGYRNASDGLDRGALFAAVEPEPTPTPAPTPTTTPTPTATPEPTPAPEPPYEPACEPTCDETIADLRTENTRLSDELATSRALVGSLQAEIGQLEQTVVARDAAITRLEAKIAAARAALE